MFLDREEKFIQVSGFRSKANVTKAEGQSAAACATTLNIPGAKNYTEYSNGKVTYNCFYYPRDDEVRIS